MSINPISAAGPENLERIAADPALKESEKIAEACRQFEALLLRQVLAETHRPMQGSGQSSTVSSIYQDLIHNTLAESISRSGMLGLAQTLQQDFTRQIKGADTEPPRHTGAAHRVPTSS
jgi:Rod binding domain-containing protein